MSHVASVVLWTFLDEDECVAGVQEWLLDNRKGPLVRVNEHAGGEKALQCDVWVGAYNYLDVDGFLYVVRSREWEYPENVVVMIQNEHDERPHER